MRDDTAPSCTPLIELRSISKAYDVGGLPVAVLHDISLTIRVGEFIAIMGPSGSGKSTLMNIIGCLDRPTGGTYLFGGRDMAEVSRDELACLRRTAFGFVFQQYNLVPDATAAENVEVPAIYAGLPSARRRQRAELLLQHFGLGGRLNHLPSQLSGGQQQRASIARALMNGGSIILADEPTGALDSRSGAAVLALLRQLASEGHTIILVTHDPAVARVADRVIQLHDGQVRSDIQQRPAGLTGTSIITPWLGHESAWSADLGEALRSGRKALLANPFRTMLTLLGIIIGVASVIALLGIGEGAKESVLAQLAVFGTNRLYVIPGGENQRGPGGTLTKADADLIRDLPNIAAAMPYLKGSVTVRHGDRDFQTTGAAVTADFPRILNWKVTDGVFFTETDERSLATVTVIGSKVRRTLFPDGSDPIQKFLLIDNVPFQIIGVLADKGALSGDADDDDTIIMPFSTGSQRVYGRNTLSWISVLVDDMSKAGATADAVTESLVEQHRAKDFRVFNRAATIEAQAKTENTMTLLLGLTAAIALLVGGIGVMNVMLMAVSERTREIGIRMATGAATGDILRQFLTEAILLSAIGGVIGIVVGLLAGLAVTLIGMPVIFTLHALIVAFVCAIVTGVVFGYMPARRAAQLDPVRALSGT
jgi:macrolide transport system ATP-binding/permease protein